MTIWKNGFSEKRSILSTNRYERRPSIAKKNRRNKNYSVEGFRPSANPEQNKAMQALRRSNAATPHIPRSRKGTRAERERQALRDQGRSI